MSFTSADNDEIISLRRKWERECLRLMRDSQGDATLDFPARVEHLLRFDECIRLIEAQRRSAACERQRPAWVRNLRSHWSPVERWWRPTLVATTVLLLLVMLYSILAPAPSVAIRAEVRTQRLSFAVLEEVSIVIERPIRSLQSENMDGIRGDSTKPRLIEHATAVNVVPQSVQIGVINRIIAPADSVVTLEVDEGMMHVEIQPRRSPAVAKVLWTMIGDSALEVQAADGTQLSLEWPGVRESGFTGYSESDGLPLIVDFLMDGSQLPVKVQGLGGCAVAEVSVARVNESNGVTTYEQQEATISFSGLEVAPVQVEERVPLVFSGFAGRVGRIELRHDEIAAVFEGVAEDVRCGLGDGKSLKPRLIEQLCARRFVMYALGFMLYAFMFLIALLRGEAPPTGDVLKLREFGLPR